jgi:ribosomal protein L7/L12
MALNISPETHLIFFEKLFADQPKVVQAVKEMAAKGAKFEQAFYLIKIEFNGKVYSQTCTVPTSNLVKGTAPVTVMLQNKMVILLFLHGAWKEIMGTEPAFELPYMAVKDTPAKAMKFMDDDTSGKTVVKAVAPPEQKMYRVILDACLTDKISLIKQIRKVFQLGLKEAKVDVADVLPVLVLNCVSEDDVKLVQKEFADFATVTVEHTDSAPTTQYSIASCLDQCEVGFASYKHQLGILPVGTFAGTVPEPNFSKSSVLAQKAPKKKPLESVISLKDAEAVGQRVHGTSGGSVYHCIAVGERVKVAARILTSGGSKAVSIRVEANKPTSEELQKIKNSGIGWKGDYGSLHLSVGSSSLGRAVGAFLMGMEVDFKEKVEKVSDLVLNEGKV